MSSSLLIENLSGFRSTDQPSRSTDRQIERELNRQGISTADQDVGGSFSELLEKSVQQVNKDQIQADHAVKELIAGRTKNVHETMLTVEKADMSLKLMMQVRNKLLDAYKEIMRMQV